MGARQDEFEQIAMPHVRSLLRAARRLSLDPAASEDLVQEAMLLAWRGFHQFNRGANARAWLFRILFNCFYARARKERKAAFASLSEVQGGSGPMLQEAVEIAEAFQALHEEHRAVLLLGVVEGFTCQETAGILGVPIGTVMSRLSRARKALRDRLSPGEGKAQGSAAGYGWRQKEHL